MTNNSSKRVDANLNIKAKILIPKTPSSLMLDGGGQVSTRALDLDTLNRIADLWREEFIRKAGYENQTP